MGKKSWEKEWPPLWGRIPGLKQAPESWQFQKYLREKYKVNTYNTLYNSLNLINIHSYITTNIDNIIQCVMDNSSRFHLHDGALYGAIKKDSTAIPYIALHGEVSNLNANLYFGKNELAKMDSMYAG